MKQPKILKRKRASKKTSKPTQLVGDYLYWTNNKAIIQEALDIRLNKDLADSCFNELNSKIRAEQALNHKLKDELNIQKAIIGALIQYLEVKCEEFGEEGGLVRLKISKK